MSEDEDDVVKDRNMTRWRKIRRTAHNNPHKPDELFQENFPDKKHREYT